MYQKIYRKWKGCWTFPSHRYQDLGGDSSFTSVGRCLSSGPSLTKGPSLNGISPVPSSSDGRFSVPVEIEEVKTAVEMLGDLIEDLKNKKSTTSKQFQDIRTYCKTNVPHLGQIFDKVGGAANGRIPSIAGSTNQNEGFDYKGLCTILKDVGHLHWVGAFFVVLAIVLDCWDKASKRSERLLEHMEKLKRFAEHVLVLRDREEDYGSSVPSKSVEVALKVILDHADYCGRGVKESSVTRCFCADGHYDGLVKLGDDLDQLYSELNLNAQLMRKEPSGETFDDTGMVEVGKRVDEALQKAESNDNASRPAVASALILTGMFGTGKSTVGQKVARQVKEKRNLDKRQCCKIHMRGDTGIKVTKKQEELYSKLHKRGLKKNFSDSRQGQRELTNLFKRQLQAKPLLLFFDDANRPEDLSELLPDKLETALHPDSILLVTTTNLHVISVLRQKGVACLDYEVDVIDKKESQAVLLEKILGDEDVQYDFPLATHLIQNEHFLKLLHLCGGVPLAINEVGSFVRERGQDFLSKVSSQCEYSLCELPFEKALSKLDSDGKRKFLLTLTEASRHACTTLSDGDPITTAKSALRRDLDSAFEHLNSNPRTRNIFMDIVTVHLGDEWSDVELACGAEDLEELKKLSMVKARNGTSGLQKPVVHVHGLLIGLSNRLKSTGECKGRRVVVAHVDSLPECFQNDQGAEVYNRVEVLKVDHCKEVITAEQLYRVTSNLRYLELHGTTIEGKCVKVPPRLTYFKCRQSSFPFALSCDLKFLAVLDVEGTWDNDVIESMPNLQKLKVENSSSLRRLGSGLKKLTIVVIIDCPNFESIEGLDSASVEHLVIVNCHKFQDFSSVTKLSCLKKLSLADFDWQPPNLPAQEPTVFTKFPQELVIPSGVQILDLSGNSCLEELPKFASNNMIKELNLQSCSALKQFGGERIGLTSLEDLHLEGCGSLKVLDVRGYEKLPLSQLELFEFMRSNNPEFQLITDEDDGARWCTALQQCIKLPFRKTRSLFVKIKSRSEQRRLKTSWTFFPRRKTKYL